MISDVTLELAFEHDEAEIRALEDVLVAHQRNTDLMLGRLSALDERLSELETNIMPVHQATERLRYLHENIGRTVADIERISLILESADRWDQPIRSGPKGLLDAYLNQMDELDRAIYFLQQLSINAPLKSVSNVLARLKTLKGVGLAECERAFATSLAKISSPFDISKLVDPFPPMFELIPERSIKDLALLNERLSALGTTNHLTDYIEKRSKCFASTLQRLGTDGMVEAARNAAAYQRGQHGYLRMLTIFVFLFEVESELVRRVIEPSQRENTLISVIEPPFDLLIETAESIIRSRRGVGIFILVDIWQHLQANDRKFQMALGSIAQGHFYSEISRMRTMLADTIKRVLVEIEQVQSVQLEIPIDGNVHEITSKTLNYLKRLYEYADSIGPLLPADQRAKDVSQQLFLYTERTLDALRAAFERKAGVNESPLAAIFMMNNFNYISKSINKPVFAPFISAGTVSRIEAQVNHHMGVYRQSWNTVMAHLLDVETKRPKSMDLKKQYRQIKSKYKAFNADLEQLCAQQRPFCIPDAELKAAVRKDIKEALVQLYLDFVNRTGSFPFSSNKEKYMIHSEESLSQLVDSLFEAQGVAAASGVGAASSGAAAAKAIRSKLRISRRAKPLAAE